MGRPPRHPPRSPEMMAHLTRALLEDRRVNGRLHHVQPMGQEWSGSDASFLSGTWSPVPDGESGTPVLVKLGTQAREVRWARSLARQAPDLIPTLFTSGHRLGSAELSWMVMERCPHGLGPHWAGHEFTMLMDAGVRFQKVARALAPGVTPADVDFGRHAELYRRGVEEGPPAPGPGRVVLDRLERDWQWVLSECRVEMCHGDLHMSNVVSRTPPPEGRALLIDYTPHAMPWAFEAAYCQVLNSIDRRRVGYTGLVAKMATQRTAHGLEACPSADLPRLSTILLAWYALRQWPISPYRHAIPDYVHEIRRYIEESAALGAR